MMFHRDGHTILVIASNIGAPQHPDWYHNLVANPTVTIEIGDEQYQATATPTTAADYDRIWAEITSLYPFFLDHHSKARRTIPVVALNRVQ